MRTITRFVEEFLPEFLKQALFFLHVSDRTGQAFYRLAERRTDLARAKEAFQFRKFDRDPTPNRSRFSKQPTDSVPLGRSRIPQSDTAVKSFTALELPAQPIDEPLKFRLAKGCS
jgi:hypothetical protein